MLVLGRCCVGRALTVGRTIAIRGIYQGPPQSTLKDEDISFLTFGQLPDGTERKVSYVKVEGHKRPGVMFAGGYQAPMKLPKTLIVKKFCEDNGHPFVMFDYEGVGGSPGDVAKLTFDSFLSSTVAVLDHLTDGPQLMIGTSMGGWMTYHTALLRPHRIHSIILPGSSMNTAHLGDNVFIQKLKSAFPEKLDAYLAGETIDMTSPWGNPIKVNRQMIPSFVEHEFDTSKPLPIHCPIRAQHCVDDQMIPYKHILKCILNTESPDTEIVLTKEGGHRMITAHALETQLRFIHELIKDYPVSENTASVNE